MFAALAENHGNLQNQINLFIALAPVVKFVNTKDSFIKLLRNNVTAINRFLWSFDIEWIGGPDYFCNSWVRYWLDDETCGGESAMHTASRLRWPFEVIPEDQ